MDNIFLQIPAIKVTQPLGTFFVFSITARKLLEVSFSEPLKYVDSNGNLTGGQRLADDKRLKEIAKYIESTEMAFPNTIILAANFTESGIITANEEERWRIEPSGEFYNLVIPTSRKLAAIIDGQHRLKAFNLISDKNLLDEIELVCSVYFDITNSYQAYLFATINSNQKKVDRSLALDHFGYNVDDEPSDSWTPEKFSVFLSRKFNIDTKSPFYNHIKVAPLNREILFDHSSEWVISTATIVDGILGLISSNPKRDRVIMQKSKVFFGRHRNMLKDIKDFSPLREYYLGNRDQDIYDIIFTFFNSVKLHFWESYSKNSYIFKTVGVQALFEILKIILLKNNNLSISNLKVEFDRVLTASTYINFSDKFFQSSGIGRNRLKNIIGIASGLIDSEKIKNKEFYLSIIDGVDSSSQKESWIWDEEAENAVINTLKNVFWNYDNKSVSMYLNGDYETPEAYHSYESFFNKLVMIAEEAFTSVLPADTEFADEQIEKFDADSLVKSLLNDYKFELQKIQWD